MAALATWAGAADAIKERGPAHPRVDGHRHGAQFHQGEHPDNQVVARADGEEYACSLSNAGVGEIASGRVALLVQLAEGADLVVDFARRVDGGRRFRGQVVRAVGCRDPKMAGDVASGVVHGL
jgi:hypothetical protein